MRVNPETTADSLALLDERRVNLSHSRTRTVNQLHALLRELMAGGAPTSLTPVSATSALRGLRARTGPDRIRVELAKELIADVRRFDEQLGANAAKMTALLAEHGTRLREIDGIGPILAARLLAAPVLRAGSPQPRRTRITPAPRPSKSRALIPRGIGSPVTETGN
jgi:transposase